ncbi:MAG: hypothetical protein ACRECQ_19745, partial [Burkholderiaceae bacterium]
MSDRLFQRAHEIQQRDATAGRVHASSTWHDAAVHAALATALGAPLESALRFDFEWYQCRGAFFHNDAHYDSRIFGVWYVAGPPADIVFPRASVRVPAMPGKVVMFDPFEVHGVLAPGRAVYSPNEYENSDTSVFIGFELDLTSGVAAAFDIRPNDNGRAISSRTRIAADN